MFTTRSHYTKNLICAETASSLVLIFSYFDFVSNINFRDSLMFMVCLTILFMINSEFTYGVCC